MKQTRIHPTSQKPQQKKPKGLYFLALFLLVAVCSAGFINSRKNVMEEKIEKSFSVNSEAETENETTEIPYSIPDEETELSDLTEITAPEETEEEFPEEETTTPEQETAPVSAADIKFALPVSGTISKDFSNDELLYNETMKDWRTHSALDISAEAGTSVKAAAAGTVESIEDDPLYGTTVTIRHSDNLVTKYGSLQPTLPISVGNFVDAGAPIGNVGNTAMSERSQGAHVHFEIIENEIPINPKDFF